MSNPSVRSNALRLSVLIVTYNRSNLLTQVVESVRRALETVSCSYELIIADDCSAEPHRSVIDAMPDAIVVRPQCNSGLGFNTNNGLAHCSGLYVLQMQDDWRFDGDPCTLRHALDFMAKNPEIGIVQLTLVGTDLPVVRREASVATFQVFSNDHLPWIRRCGVRPYSDQPHIKRRAFIDCLGPYLEAVPMTVCENEFKLRVARQRTWRIAMVEGPPCFVHIGAAMSFNPGGRRHFAVRFLHKLPFGKTLLEPFLRRVTYYLEHLAARIWSRRYK